MTYHLFLRFFFLSLPLEFNQKAYGAVVVNLGCKAKILNIQQWAFETSKEILTISSGRAKPDTTIFKKGHGELFHFAFGTSDEVLLAVSVEGCVESVVTEPGGRSLLPIKDIILRAQLEKEENQYSMN